MKRLLLAMLFLPALAQAFEPECDKLVRLDVALKVLPGPLKLVKSGPPPSKDFFTCSYMLEGKEKVGLALTVSKSKYWPAKPEDHLRPLRNGKVDELQNVGKGAIFYTEAPGGKGWYGLPVRGVNASANDHLFQLRIQRDGGDEDAMRTYLVDTMRHAIATAP